MLESARTRVIPMMNEPVATDERTPSPPDGYSRVCELSREQQIAVVAQFHMHQIKPNRIAYRMGIDIAFIEALIAGEVEAEKFRSLCERFGRQRYRERMRESGERNGAARFELQREIEKEWPCPR